MSKVRVGGTEVTWLWSPPCFPLGCVDVKGDSSWGHLQGQQAHSLGHRWCMPPAGSLHFIFSLWKLSPSPPCWVHLAS